MLTPGADPVRKVSIIPRGQALGETLSSPDSDRVSYSREDLEAETDVALGGHVAEEVIYGKITTGAESDSQQLTGIARHRAVAPYRPQPTDACSSAQARDRRIAEHGMQMLAALRRRAPGTGRQGI
jgi:hypothetical protein